MHAGGFELLTDEAQAEEPAAEGVLRVVRFGASRAGGARGEPKPNKLGTFSTMVHCGATFFHSFYTTYLFYVRAVYEYHRQVVQYTMLTSV